MHDHDHDQDFHPPSEKSLVPLEGRPHSKLAVVSLVFGILGFAPLTIIGSIIAIVTGHAALEQIREEGGRLGDQAMARAGRTLGYIQFTIFVVVVAFCALWMYGRSGTVLTTPATPDQVVLSTTKSNVPRSVNSEPGVKMVNEMERADHKLIEDQKLIDAGKDEEIVACYTTGQPTSNPELALLTNRRLIYHKDGRTTTLDLKEVTNLMDDEKTRNSYASSNRAFIDFEQYYIEVQGARGTRMRIKIKPPDQGKGFYNALESAWKAAGGTPREDGVPVPDPPRTAR